MRATLKQAALVPTVVLCLIMIPSTVAVVSQTMGNITFQCDDGWKISGPNCYLLVDTPMTLEDAMDYCEKYGSNLVEITDEVEAKDVGWMVQKDKPSWGHYWIGNVQTQAVDACGGLWDVGEPKDVTVTSNIYVAANAPQGRWQGRSKTSRLPVVCKTNACVQGTFRCKDGTKCLSDNWKCDGLGDCNDMSDESDCPSNNTWYRRESSGTLTTSYEAGKTYTWYLEGTPGVVTSITFTSLDVEEDVDYVEVWSGGPSFATSTLQARLTGSLTNRMVYGYNNFLIVRLVADLSNQLTGFVASWGPDDELSQRNREVNATDEWTELTSPYYGSDPSPLSYIRHYTVTAEEGYVITMEVLTNELGEYGFEYDSETLASVNDVNIFPDTYVSRSNTFSFYLVSNGCEGPEKFRARVKRGCAVDITRANGFVRPPLFESNTVYPPSVTCTYVIRAPQDAQRAFQLFFNESQLADAADYVKVYDGGNSSFSELTPTGGYTGSSANTSTIFASSGPVVYVEFKSSMVQTTGSFELVFNLACPTIPSSANMSVSSTDTQYGSEVTFHCDTGYAFAQEEFANEEQITIRCESGGKWNVSRLPTCQVIYCGVPEPINNGFFFNGSGDASFGATVTYKCYSGFTMTGSDTSTCGAGFAWSAKPTCQASQCPTLSQGANLNMDIVTGGGTDFGTIVSYTCDAGYDLEGVRYSVCQTDGTWSHAAPNCSRIQCPIPEIAMATLTPTSPVSFEDLLRVTCPDGYVINGTNDTSSDYPCLASRGFNVSRDMCVDKDECDAALNPNPCHVDGHEVCVNTEGSYRCDCADKYKRNDADTACVVIDRCTDGTSGCDSENGYCNSTNNGEDYVCHCKDGYILFTEDGLNGHTIPSTEDGMTPGDVYHLNHTCVPVRCQGLPGNPSNGKVLTNKTSSDFFDFGETVEYRCNFGYVLETDNLSSTVLMCESSTHFSATAPTCAAETCEALTATGLVANIYPNATTNAGDMVLLECDSQTGPHYNKTLFCAYDNSSDTFRLQGDAPHCPAVDCGSIEPTGGATFTPPTDTGLGSSFEFTCADGFTLYGTSSAGNSTVTCQQNGRWGLGNLTCNGASCVDPGTPGGMIQVEASFEVGGDVVYSCSRQGFSPNPTFRRCVYNNSSGQAEWNGTMPVCEDVADPEFTFCPNEPIKLKLYYKASSQMTKPVATDNSGLVMMTVSPSWFSLDIPLDTSVNVTYTAQDAAGRTATCPVTIIVNEPGVLPTLKCPDHLILDVSSSTPYNKTLAENITVDSDVRLTYSPGPIVTVAPWTVGTNDIRVTATDVFGFERQCAFIVEIKPSACLSYDIEEGASAKNSEVNCSAGSAGIINCTVTCKDNFAFQDGTTTMSYDCQGSNEWQPALPAQSCVPTTDVQYLYVVNVSYSFGSNQISLCQADLTAKLEQAIPNQTINTCVFDGGNQNMHFSVTGVEYPNPGIRKMTAIIKLAVTNDLAQITQGDYDACGPRFNDASYTGSFFADPVTFVDCGAAGIQNLTRESHSLVRSGKTCSIGSVVQSVGGTDKCVPCEPGNYYNGSVCLECPNGKYQDLAGQTQCKDCENGAQFTNQPRLSSGQCVASCPLGFYTGQGFTATPARCMPCAEDSYLDTTYTATCRNCTTGTTTSGLEGATSASACKAKCPAGEYPVNNTDCALCPVGYYKSTVENVACTACGANQTTARTGSPASTDCENLIPAACQNGGTPMLDYHRSYCDCPLGYYGDLCDKKDVDACDSSPCVNNGTCNATDPSSYTCTCPSELNCIMEARDVQIGASSQLTIQNYSINLSACQQLCIDTEECKAIGHLTNPDYCAMYSQYTSGSTPDAMTFIKSCSWTYLFGGNTCETDLIDNCNNNTCYDRNFCRDLIDAADCVCPSDSKYTGARCDIDLDLCGTTPCQNEGECVDSGNGVRYTCICKPGYTGDNCETDINECEVNPDGCLYGGICNDLVNSYSCSCGRYSGDHCQTIPDFCALSPDFCANGVCYNDYNISSAVCVCHFPYRVGASGQCEEIDICEEKDPCQNNSTCSRVSPGETSCQCLPGFTGSLCQHNIDDCASDPCGHGQCTDLVNGYSCDCEPGYDGTNCDNNINDCPGNCSATNTETDGCEDLVDDYRCRCKAGFTGKDCEVNIDECQSLPCRHGGVCSESTTPGEYTCSCVDGWTGQNCESLPQFCNDSTCDNSGVCFSLQNSFFCQCVHGTFGETCEATSDVCDIVEPCTAASTCLSVDGTATCQCPDNYTGGSCSLIKDSCSSDPCQNGGTCVTLAVGYTCRCAEGYSGDNCTTEASACDSVNCPAGSECVEEDSTATCRCGANQLMSGGSCKNMSNYFDIYFTKRGKAMRSTQPFRMTADSLTLMFWIAPLAESGDNPVQLRLSNGSTILAVNKENITFGYEDPVQLQDTNQIVTGLKDNHWNQFAVTWNGSHYDSYLNGLDMAGGVTSAGFPSQNELVYIYIGADFKGYISQVTVWGRMMSLRTEALSMYSHPRNPSSTDLLARWSGYQLSDNLWARVIHPSIAKTSEMVCDNGQPGPDACSASDKEPPTVTSCPNEISAATERLVQVNDHLPNTMFAGAVRTVSSLDRTVLTFGVHRLVYVASDEDNNVAFCHINAYITRQGQTCSNKDGLNAAKIMNCDGKGQTVQCPNNGIAPLSPRILTCGKLGSYNLDDQYQWPNNIICGASGTLKYKITLMLRYKLGIDCDSNTENLLRVAIKAKVVNLMDDWPTLCPDSNCDNARPLAKCDGASSTFVTVTLIITSVPATLTHRVANVQLTARELFQTATLELNAFAAENVFRAKLQKEEVMILAEKSCSSGFGLHDDGCVECTQGSFLNEATGMCELCPIGSYTNTDGQTACTPCMAGQTTLQLGATQCYVECTSGQYLDVNDGQCKDCLKNFYQNETGQVACKPCPAGTATETTGTTSVDLCYDTCLPGTELRNSTCVPCARGTYSDGIQQEACVECPSGNTTAGEQSTSINQCYQTACNPGQSRNSTTNVCEECDYGFFQPEKWQDECLPCNDSYTTMSKVSTSADQCLFVCGPGQENLSGTSCSPCDIGFYRTDSLADRFTNCTACNSTFTTAGQGSTSPSDCNIRICNAGQYRNVTDNECYDCPIGQYQPDSLQTECLPCDRNLTTRQKGSNNVNQCVFYCAAGYKVLSASDETCTACDRGYYKSNEGVAKFDVCQACSTNTTNNVASVSEADCNINICEAGQKISSDGGCEDCPKDFYQDVALPDQNTDCQPCGTGKATMQSKQTSLSDCQPICSAGEQYNSSSTSCEPCPLGTWSTGNDTQRFEQCVTCPDGFVTVNEMTGATSIDNCTLRDCPPGQFIDGDNCTDCPVGKYQDMPRKTDCASCPSGKNTSGGGHDEESDCTIYCDSGKEQVPGRKTCQLCQEDFIKPAAGSGRCNQCTGNYTSDASRTVCNVSFCDSGFIINNGNDGCDACGVGTYKAQRGNTDQCINCPSNTTTSGVASTSESDCNKANCVQGFYSPDDTLPCLACPVGTFQNETGNQNCTACDSGFTTSGVASTAPSDCSVKVCPVGQFRTSQNQCQDCDVGSFQNETGQTDCLLCPPGYTTTGTGSNSTDDCRIVCPVGQFRNDSTNTCEDCPISKYQENTGQTSCSSCPTSYTTAAPASNSSSDCYIVCQPGQYATSRTTCGTCPNGKYQASSGASTCDSCASGETTLRTGSTSRDECQPICGLGQYLNETAKTCMNCSLGTYNPVAGNKTAAVTKCLDCPYGFTTSMTGTDNISSCSVEDCVPGFYKRPGVGCKECPKGTYQPLKSQTSCIPCDGNLTTYTTGRTSNESCITRCTDGEEYDAVIKGCSPCRLGFYRRADQMEEDCVKCDRGFTTLAPGQSNCVKEATGITPRPVRMTTIRIKIRLRIETCENRIQVRGTITDFIINTLVKLDIRFPAICRNRCVNVVITFSAGCLQEVARGRRAIAGSDQEVELAVTGVSNEVEDNDTKKVHDALTTVKNAFIDVDEATLAENQVEFLGVENAAYIIQCLPGEYSNTNGSECYPCATGTYSTGGMFTVCTPCDENTYQNSTGQSSCINCPAKTYTTTPGATSAAACRRRCDEDNSDQTYCTGHGTCVFDVSTTNGVRCQCDKNYGGNTCSARLEIKDDKPQMIGGIVGGASAFLLLLLLIIGIVAYVRRSVKKGRKGMKKNGHLYQNEEGISEGVYPDYNYPFYDNGRHGGFTGKPAVMYMNPAADPEVREFYAMDRSIAPPSRPRSQSYESEWRNVQDVL